MIIPEISPHEGKLFGFSNGRLTDAHEMSQRLGLLATIQPKHPYGHLFIIKKAKLVAVEIFAPASDTTPYYNAVLPIETKDDVASVQQLLTRLLSESAVTNRAPLKLGRFTHLGERFETVTNIQEEEAANA